MGKLPEEWFRQADDDTAKVPKYAIDNVWGRMTPLGDMVIPLPEYDISPSAEA